MGAPEHHRDLYRFILALLVDDPERLRQLGVPAVQLVFNGPAEPSAG
jgi:hypothetical protein